MLVNMYYAWMALQSAGPYLINDMHHAVLRYDVRLYNLGSVDIVYTITDTNDQGLSLLRR